MSTTSDFKTVINSKVSVDEVLSLFILVGLESVCGLVSLHQLPLVSPFGEKGQQEVFSNGNLS